MKQHDEKTLSVSLTPAQISRMRGKIAHSLDSLIPLAVECVEGKRTWSNTQAAVFRTLLGKVVPDLSQSHATIEHKSSNVRELTRDELAEIAALEDRGSLPEGARSQENQALTVESVPNCDILPADAPADACTRGGGGDPPPASKSQKCHLPEPT